MWGSGVRLDQKRVGRKHLQSREAPAQGTAEGGKVSKRISAEPVEDIFGGTMLCSRPVHAGES